MKNLFHSFSRTALGRSGLLLGWLLLAGFAQRAQAQFVDITSPANTPFPSITNPVTFSGTTSIPFQDIIVYVDFNFFGIAQADPSGNWTLPSGPPLSTGSHQAYARGNSCNCTSPTISFSIGASAPSGLTTDPATSIAATSAVVSGFIADDGGDPVTNRGVMYSTTNPNPNAQFDPGTVVVSSGTTGIGAFSTTLPGLTPSTFYYARIFASNFAGGVALGNVVGFTTAAAVPTVTLTPATLPGGTQGSNYNRTIGAAGGTAPYTFAVVAGALPTGLTLASGGALTGTLTALGTFNFTVRATDASTGPGAPYSGSQGYSVTVTPVPVKTWNGSVSANWATAANWTPTGVPTGTTNAVISAGVLPAPVLASGLVSVRNLTVQAGASFGQTGGTLLVNGAIVNNGTFAPTSGTVALNAGTLQAVGGSAPIRFFSLNVGTGGATLNGPVAVQGRLTLTGSLATNGQVFTLESSAAATAMVENNGGSITGTVTVQRYIGPAQTSGPAYRHLAAPVSGATVGGLATAGFVPVVNGAFNTSPAPGAVTLFPTIQGYNQARLATATNNLTAFDKGWFSPAALGDVLTPGRGYTVNLAAGQAVSFVGAATNGDVPVALTRAAANTSNAADAGWQFLGNPYPSPLNYDLVAVADRVNLDAAIYVYEASSQYAGAYRAFLPAASGNPATGNGILAMGQGFFARMTATTTSGSLTFRNSQRVLTLQNPVFQRSTADARPLLELTLQGATGPADALTVYFAAGATAGFDSQLDAAKLPNPSGLNLAAEAAGQPLAICGLPAPGTAAVTVPLHVRVPVSGTYTLAAAQLLNLTATPTYLRDRLTGTLVNLATQPRYTFTQNAANTAARFELVFSPQRALATAPASLTEQVAVFPNPATGTAFMELPASLARTAATAVLVDALGRPVRTFALPAGLATHALPLAEVPAGVYTLRVATAQGTVSKKLVVE